MAATPSDGQRLIRLETRMDYMATKEDVANLKADLQKLMMWGFGLGFVALGGLTAILKYLG